MKKALSIFLIFNLLLTSFAFSSTAKQVNRKDCVYVSSYKNPTNSVIFYGYVEDTKYISFSQMNPKNDADNQVFGDYIISRPVDLESVYRLQAVAGENTVCKWSKIYDIDDSSFDIVIPNEVGLVYIGSYVGYSSLVNGKFDEEGSIYQQKVTELMCLKKVLKFYKGTDWEPVIKNRIKEITDAQKAEKEAIKQANAEKRAEAAAAREAARQEKLAIAAAKKAEQEALKLAEQEAAAQENSETETTETVNPVEGENNEN